MLHKYDTHNIYHCHRHHFDAILFNRKNTIELFLSYYSGIGTQGGNKDSWVTVYSLEYSEEGETWTPYNEGEQTKVIYLLQFDASQSKVCLFVGLAFMKSNDL